MSEGSGQGPEATQPVVPKTPDSRITVSPTETPTTQSHVEIPSGNEAMGAKKDATTQLKLTPEITQVPEEIRTRLVKLLQLGKLNPEEKKELSGLLTAGKASLVEKTIEIDETTRTRLKELAEFFDDHFKRIESAQGISMGPYWLSLAKSQTEIGADLTKILPDSGEQTLFWNNIVRILEEAKKGVSERAYLNNLQAIYGSFPTGPLYETTLKFIKEQAKSFVEEARGKSIDEIFTTASEGTVSSTVGTLAGRLYLVPASEKVLESSSDTDIVTTPEGKMAWAFVARSMTGYMKNHFSRFISTKS